MFDGFIRFHARVRPHDTAVVTPAGEVSYAAFTADIDRMTSQLRDADLPADGLVAVRMADPYVHCLILFGLARLGVASASYGPSQGERLASLLKPDLVITDQAGGAGLSGGEIDASPAWIASVLRRPASPHPVAAVRPDALARVVTSSGTTGLPKKVGWSWRYVKNRVASTAVQAGPFNALSRVLSAIGIETGAFYSYLGAWALGGTVLLLSPSMGELAAALPRLSPSTLVLAPIQLKALLEQLPSGFTPMPNLYLALAGSHLPPAVRDAARLRLTPNVWISYASTEGGAIALGHVAHLAHDPSAVGWVTPWSEVEIVDDADTPLPAGRSGRVRVRGEEVATGYLDDVEATQANFKDGWFYPGDIGSLSADGLLRIEGRTNEVMNFGGVKFLPSTIEDAVLACPGVKDVAAFSMPDGEGVATPWLAVVRGEGFDEAAVARALFIPSLPQVHLVWIDEIPRNAANKIQRDQLQDAAAMLARKA